MSRHGKDGSHLHEHHRMTCDRCKALIIWECLFTALLIGSLYVAMVHIIDRNADAKAQTAVRR